ncbi:MAG: FecR family protein [Gammaproteobacteria bacterium]|nr:FecR family protein [Gammaproteobacteria bacterium]
MATNKRYKREKPGLMPRIILVLMFVLAPMIAYAEAGKIIFLIGDATVLSAAHGEQKAKSGMDLEPGDILRTGAKGQLQVRMADGGLIAVRPDSEFKIEEFVYNQDVGTDKSFFTLLKGGFRSVTGAIGEANKPAYRVETPIATIGIRGTDYSARLCDTNCSQADGLYISVLTGGVALSNDTGVVEINPGDFGYVQDNFSTPVLLDAAPGDILFANQGATDSAAPLASTSETLISNAQTVSSTTTDTTVASTSVENTVTSLQANLLSVDMSADSNSETTTDTVNSVNSVNAVDSVNSSTVTESPIVLNRTIAMAGFGQSPNVSHELADNVTSTTNGELDSFQITSTSGSVSQFVRDANIVSVERGSTSGGEISWGRWTAMNVAVNNTTSSTLEDKNSIHWIASNVFEDSIVFDKTASGSYKIVGGTNPTDNMGNIGTLNTVNSTFAVNFSSSTADFVANVSMADLEPENPNTNTWELAYRNMAITSDGKFGGELSDIRSLNHPVYSNPINSGSATGSFAGGLSTSRAPMAALVSYFARTDYEGFGPNRVTQEFNGVAAAELVTP